MNVSSQSLFSFLTNKFTRWNSDNFFERLCEIIQIRKPYFFTNLRNGKSALEHRFCVLNANDIPIGNGGQSRRFDEVLFQSRNAEAGKRRQFLHAMVFIIGRADKFQSQTDTFFGEGRLLSFFKITWKKDRKFLSFFIFGVTSGKSI